MREGLNPVKRAARHFEAKDPVDRVTLAWWYRTSSDQGMQVWSKTISMKREMERARKRGGEVDGKKGKGRTGRQARK